MNTAEKNKECLLRLYEKQGYSCTASKMHTHSSYLLTPRSTVLEKLTGLQLVKEFPTFYGTQGPLPHSQVPATCPCPEPD